ncbi:MAG: TetR/AcrR family transcriptional regulator [Lachnospiraceae bacterium]|nr:TetR/AcrR family transcriptional regulator [Lachnospiraceae bacterium]
MNSNYHHGNLKSSLIEAGLKIINESGEDSLSLRKVASFCDVSHSAPYAHFKNKDELISAIKKMITEKFTFELNESIKNLKEENIEEAIKEMGKRYILFFYNNPDYYYFLFRRDSIEINLNMDKNMENEYLPFKILKDLLKKYFIQNNIDLEENEKELKLLNLWAIVQGYSSIACMNKVNIKQNWEEIVEKIFEDNNCNI